MVEIYTIPGLKFHQVLYNHFYALTKAKLVN